MVAISAQQVKELREQTGAGMMDCKKALQEVGGDVAQAIEHLRKKGLKDLSKRAGKVAAEGMIMPYIHTGDRIGVMVELNSETDFVARGEEFKELARRIAMHVAWASPKYLKREEVPAADIESEKEIFLAQLKEGQKAHAEKILSGKLDKFYAENCLLEQEDTRDPENKKTFQALIDELSSKVGEKIELRRFVRFEVGEGVEKEQEDFAAEVAATVANT